MCKRLTFLLFVAMVLGLAVPALAATHPGQMGVNIGHYTESAPLFVDWHKQAYRWLRLSDGESLTSDDVDSEGWPACDVTYIQDSRPVAEWAGEIDDPVPHRWDIGGTYKCSFQGKADVSAWAKWQEGDAAVQNLSYDSTTNTTTFDLWIDHPASDQEAHYGFYGIDFANTQRTSTSDTNTGFTDLEILAPGYTRDTTQTFTTEFLNCLNSASWAAVRYHFTAPNNEHVTYPDQTTWDERKLTTHASQDNLDSVLPNIWQAGAWEYVIEIANATDKDPWINLPVSATTTYVTNVATMLKNDLETGLNIYVENSNEVWNSGFPQQQWNADQAAALGITEHENYARRTVELSQIFADVFGSAAINDRVRVMLCTHSPQIDWWVPEMMAYINNNYGPPSNYIYGMASQGYFGDDTASTGETVQEILAASEQSVTDQMDKRKAWLATAANWNLPGGYCFYEAGPGSMGGIGNTTNIANRILAHRDFGMQEVMEYNYDEAFAGLGGNLGMHFALWDEDDRYGSWNVTDEITLPDRFWKTKAVRDIIGESTYKNGDWSPVAVDEAYTTAPNTDLSVSAPGVLENDTDAEGDPLTAVLVTAPVNGSLTLNSDGSFTYSPYADFVGKDSFEYAADDGTLQSCDGVVEIEVTSGYTPEDCHVADIEYFWRDNGSLYVPAADVLIHDNGKMPVEDARVKVSLKDGCTVKWGVTNSDGWAYVRALGGECHVRSPSQGSGTLACVQDVVHDVLPYDSSDNIVTCCDDADNCTGPDNTAPAAPTNLSATAVSDSQIDLDWDDNTEDDLAYYNVYRDGSQIATDVTVSEYSDTGLAASTTYCYTVTAVDTSGNESSHSNEACATTEAACDETTMHVESVTVTTVDVGQGNKKGRAEVVIYDNCGGPVADATVYGTFSGDISESGSGVTDSTGTAVIETTGTARGGVSITFCVDDVTHASLSYDSNANVETCDSN